MKNHGEELRRVLQEFFDRRARGEVPSPQEYLERYPQFRRELSEHFETIEVLDRLVRGKEAGPREETVLGDYRIVREIGRGGMGIVFLAEQVSLHRQVALKLLSAPLAQSYRTVERFRREAEIAARLRHPNLVSVYTVGEAQGYAFFAMEYLEGVSLSQLLARLREAESAELPRMDLRALVREMAPPPEAEKDETDVHTPPPSRPVGYFGTVAHIVAEIADGLAYAHVRGVIHRDVKPSNVLLDRRLSPHLADFGLARETGLETLSSTGDLVGTPYYMSPEVAMAGRIQVDHRTDIYSLGVTLFELLTLKVPFSGSSSQEVLRRIVLEPPPAPRRLNRAVPRELQVIALKAMEKDPDHRFSTAGEMAEDLRRFLRFEPIHAQPPGPVRVAARFLRRHRVAASLVALLAVAAVGAAAAGRAAVRMARLEEGLLAARAAESDGETDESKLVEARRIFERHRRRFGDSEEARLGSERVGRKIEETFARRTAEAEESLLRSAEGWTMEADLAAEAFRRALVLREDPAVRAKYEALRGIFPVSIESEPPGARVTVHPVKGNGEIGSGRFLGETPLRDVKLRTGVYRFVVEKPGFGYGEYSSFLRSEGEDRNLRVLLRRTTEVVTNMARIPGGKYRIGLDPTDRPREIPIYERPGQEVESPTYYIDLLEVSNDEYARFVGETDRVPPPSWRKSRGQPPAGEGNLPVVEVTWDDARAYAEWAGKRLPTETEWEVACRGPEGYLYPWGNEFDPERAHIAPLLVLKPGMATYTPRDVDRRKPVDSIPGGRSPFGVFHLAGNVGEWVWDPWTPREGTSLADAWWLAPTGQRVIRGGDASRTAGPVGCTCSARSPGRPRSWGRDIGFRCAKSVLP